MKHVQLESISHKEALQAEPSQLVLVSITESKNSSAHNPSATRLSSPQASKGKPSLYKDLETSDSGHLSLLIKMEERSQPLLSITQLFITQRDLIPQM